MQAIVIPPFQLALSFLPVLVLLFIFFKWGLLWRELVWAGFRMVVQLIGIGYILTIIFNQNHFGFTLLVILFMIAMASWISLRSVKEKRTKFYVTSLLSLFLGSTPVLIWVTAVVIPGVRWNEPQFMIPLAGMIFANSMNAISLAYERYLTEVDREPLEKARRKSLSAALIPQINSYFAVGLVSLPGLMSGQILSGVDPLLAVRYQIVVMTMILGSCGLTAALFLKLLSRNHLAHESQSSS